MKLTVIGGGGVRSLFLAKSIAQQAESLGITQLCLMDSDADKLRIFGGLARAGAGRLAPKLACTLTTNPVQAVTDADYVITTIRVGGDAARVRDERIALERGVLGQETTGAAGFSYAMRSVPVLLEYCELVKKHAKPGAKVFNFTNPAGLVSQALRDAGYDFTYGICDAPSGMLAQFAKLYGGTEITGRMYGLNHLSFFSSITLDGQEIMPRLMEDAAAYKNTDLRFFSPALVRHLGCVPNEYLYYYYYREQAVENVLRAPRTRGEAIADFNHQMQAELAGMDTEANFEAALAIFEKWYGRRENEYMASETGVKREAPWSFDLYGPDGGGYAGVALQYIRIAGSGGAGRMILCVPNGDAMPGMAPDDVVEVSCDIDQNGVRPHRFSKLPQRNLELIRRVKFYERAGARAILEKDKAAAVDCLMMHPLVNSYSLAVQLCDEYYQHNAAYL